MDPAKPPLPAPRNLPFHLSGGGSQSSILISESSVGLRSICTRQCADSIGGGGAPGVVDASPGPAATRRASVTTAWSRCNAERLSHDVCAEAADATMQKPNVPTKTIVLRIETPGLLWCTAAGPSDTTPWGSVWPRLEIIWARSARSGARTVTAVFCDRC